MQLCELKNGHVYCRMNEPEMTGYPVQESNVRAAQIYVLSDEELALL